MSAPRSRAWVEVSLAAVVENARTVARIAGTRLLPMVKANAYGVGAVAVSRALEALGPWGYGVATVEEGVELRAAGITRPVLCCSRRRRRGSPSIVASGLTPVFDSAGAIWSAWLAGGGDPCSTSRSTPGWAARWRALGRDGARVAARRTRRASRAASPSSIRPSAPTARAAASSSGSCGAWRELPRRPRLLHVANSAAALAGPAVRRSTWSGRACFCTADHRAARRPGRPVVSVRARVVERTACARRGTR